MRKIIILIFILFNVVNTSAKAKYQSKFLEYLHEQAIAKKIISFFSEDVSVDTLASHYIFIMPNDVFSKGILVEFTKDTILTQIGLNIFDSSLRQMYPNLIKFAERYLFGKVFKIKSNKFFSNEMSKVLCSFNGTSIKNWEDSELNNFLEKIIHIQFDYSIKEIKISLSDSLNRSLEIILPQNINLIMGMDKKELDDYVFNNIRSGYFCGDYEKKGKSLYDTYLKFDDNVFFIAGKQLYKGLDQTCYFENKDGNYKLLLNSKYPLISVKNVLLNPELKEINLKVEHHLYGKEVKYYKSSYERLFKCLGSHKEIFSGFESGTTDSLKYLVVFFDESLMNSHLLSIILPRNSLYESKPVYGRAAVYTNIRSDNIKNIFKNYMEGKKIIKYELSD